MLFKGSAVILAVVRLLVPDPTLGERDVVQDPRGAKEASEQMTPFLSHLTLRRSRDITSM